MGRWSSRRRAGADKENGFYTVVCHQIKIEQRIKKRGLPLPKQPIKSAVCLGVFAIPVFIIVDRGTGQTDGRMDSQI
jgi:hypothetical protein